MARDATRCNLHPTLALFLLLLSPIASQQLTVGSRIQGRTEYVYRPVGGSNPFGAVVPGLALAAGSSALLWWNEGRTAREEQMLAAARRAVRPLDAATALEATELDEEQKLVHLSGPVTASGVQDTLFQEVARPGSLLLQRATEQYAWRETEHTRERRVSKDTVQRETSYSYSTEWTSNPQRKHFHTAGHHNPTPRLAPGVQVAAAADARLKNGVHVPAALLEQLDGWTAVSLRPPGPEAEAGAELEHADLRAGVAIAPREGGVLAPAPDGGRDTIYFSAPGMPSPRERESMAPHPSLDETRRVRTPRDVRTFVEAAGGLDGPGTMERVESPPAPVVGDVRVHFSEVRPPLEGVSILGSLASEASAEGAGGGAAMRSVQGRLSGARGSPSITLRPWRPKMGRELPSLFMLVRGKATPAEMLKLARARGARRKWLHRGAGAALMWLGATLSLSFLPALAARLPFLGGLAASLVGATTSLVALGASLGASALVIAISWARFRPAHAARLGAAACAALAAQSYVLVRLHAARSLGAPGGAAGAMA